MKHKHLQHYFMLWFVSQKSHLSPFDFELFLYIHLKTVGHPSDPGVGMNSEQREEKSERKQLLRNLDHLH
jgi:hypothetical protein